MVNLACCRSGKLAFYGFGEDSIEYGILQLCWELEQNLGYIRAWIMRQSGDVSARVIAELESCQWGK